MAQTLANRGRTTRPSRATKFSCSNRQPPAKQGDLGYLYYVKRQPRKALEYWTRYLDSNPDSLPVLTMTAWLLATDPDAAVRNGGKALALAQRAAKISQGQDAGLGGVGGRNGRKRRFYGPREIVEQANRLPDRPFSEAGMLEMEGEFRSGKPYVDGMRKLLIPMDASPGK